MDSKYFFIYRFGEYKLGNSLKFTYFFREYSLLVRTRNSVSEKFKKKIISLYSVKYFYEL